MKAMRESLRLWLRDIPLVLRTETIGMRANLYSIQECKKFRATSMLANNNEDYTQLMLKRLEILSFVTGESQMKSDALQELCEIVSSELKLDQLERVLDIVRAFILDWDRIVRARAFRAMRLCLSTSAERSFIKQSIHTLTIIRLESSKSVLERTAILRLIAKWLDVSSDEDVTSALISSCIEMIVAHVSALSPGAPLAPFYGTMLSMVLSVSTVRPFSRSVQLLLKLVNSTFSQLPEETQVDLLDALVFSSERSRVAVQIDRTMITPSMVSLLSQSVTGLAILSHSLVAETLMDSPIRSIILDSVDAPVGPMILGLLRSIPDVADTITTAIAKSLVSSSPVDESLVELLHLLSVGDCNLLGDIQWRYPAWVSDKLNTLLSRPHKQRTEEPLPVIPLNQPSIPRITPATRLSPEESRVLDEICALSSSVQLKAKTSHLSSKRQRDPKMFQSVSLWFLVYDRLLAGSFNLHARRVIHGLFVHTLCSRPSLQSLDSCSVR